MWRETPGYSCEYIVATSHTGDENTHVNIYLRDEEGAMNVLYYEKVGYIWTFITEDIFYRRFHIEVLNRSVLETITLDAKGEHTPKNVYINKLPNFPFIAYAPNVGYRIREVKNGRVLWTARSEDERCIYASFYPKDVPTLGYMIINTYDGPKELFFKKIVELWMKIQKEEYMKKLEEAGFNESTFTNEITMDVSNVDRDIFYDKVFQLDDHSIGSYVPLVGLRLNEIVDSGNEIWKASGEERCTYMNLVFKDKKPFILFILAEDSKNARSVLYYAKDTSGKWTPIKKSECYAYIPDNHNVTYERSTDGKRVIMSSFKNRDGLKIATYSSTVENAKADIILIHGIRSHFKSEFCASNTEWNFEHLDFPAFPYANPFGGYVTSMNPSPIDTYGHLFERVFTDGMDASEVSPRYEYRHSFVEFLNKMGYSVYGLDLQSHGLSEAQTDKKCHVKDFKDYVNDLLQFISIVKRGAFNDSSEVWNESLAYKSHHSTSRKLILHGHSMGANVAVQAIQEFHRHAGSQAKLIDGLIVTSGMFSLDHYFDVFWKKIFKYCYFDLYVKYSPMGENTYETFLDYGEAFDLFIRYRDPFFQTHRLTFMGTQVLFKACDEVKKEENMAYYPKNLPTIFIHTKDDEMCDVKGQREIVEKLNRENATDIKLVEFEGRTHYLTIPQSMIMLKTHIYQWLDRYT